MSKKYYETEEFNRMQDEWYAKLKDDKFIDIERDEETKKDLVYPEKFNLASRKEEYYDICNEILKDMSNFRTVYELALFEKHTKGFSTRELEIMFTDSKYFERLTNMGIWKVIRRVISRSKFTI